MKRLNKTFLTAATLIGLAIGCKDESLSPYIPPNGAANGLGQFVSLSNGALLPSATGFYDQSAIDANVFFDENNQANGITYKLQWLSYDNRVNISSIELYVEYNETYSDPDRNPLIAAHGGPSKGPSYPAGKFWKSITPTAQRTPVDITITPADMYTLFQGNTFDYDDDGTAENIFSAAAAAITKTDRTVSTKRFFSSRSVNPTPTSGSVTLAADQFRIRWRLIGDDGTGYGSWSASVCSETVGINCVGTFRVNKDVFNPKATYARQDDVDRNGDGKKDASDNKVNYKAGDKTTITITFDKDIATPPTVELSPLQGTLGPVTAVSGSSKAFTVEYTAPAGFTGAVSVKTLGAVSTGSAPAGGLTQVASSTTINVDNTAPLQQGAISGLTGASTVRVGRGGSSVITVTFNEAMSALKADALKLSITTANSQGLDTLTNRVMTLAANGLSASYLYLWKDSSNPFDNTLGNVTVTISGGKDLAGNTFSGTSGTFVNDAGGVVADAVNSPTTGFISAYTNVPTATLAATWDLGTQLRWTISQSNTTPAPPVSLTGTSTGGTWFWVAVTAGSTAPTQATRTVTGLANPVYNGFGTITNSKASGSTTSSGENFTPFTANGTFDIYMYFVSSTGNVSPNSLVLSNVVMN